MGRTPSDIAHRIVEAARGRFLGEGVDGASLRAIAGDAGTSIGMVYYYFPTKDELFLAVVEDIYAALALDLARALAPDAGVPERLRRLYRRIGAMSERESMTIRLILREALISSSRLARVLERFQRGHIPLVLAAIADGTRDGTIDPSIPPLLATLVAFAVGAAPQLILARAGDRLPAAGVPRGPALADLLVELLLGGLAPRPGRRGAARPAAAGAGTSSPPPRRSSRRSGRRARGRSAR
jgi:AcrR family transcriptional regulator